MRNIVSTHSRNMSFWSYEIGNNTSVCEGWCAYGVVAATAEESRIDSEQLALVCSR